ncbi:MAG TPA: D-glycerate dehydrogenase [Gemmatimonadales bacterium]|nr:D-glycerate dehydrogenase [Gemmatimonadales bacterium]
MNERRPYIIVTRRLPQSVETALADGFEVQLNPADRQFTRDELRAALAGADGLLCTLTDPLDRSVLLPGPHRARILASFGVGVNHVDLDAARQAGLLVTNTPDVLTDCTADLTIALILMTLRRLGEGERLLRAGEWRGWTPTHHLGRQVTGRTLGIVGFGRIGRAVALRAHRGFGMRILVHSRTRPERADLERCGASYCDSLDALLPDVEILSLHVPATAQTRGMMDARRLALLPAGAVLINTARGDLVDEPALIQALQSGRLGAAGLDVFAREPEVPAALREMENVVLLPHLGSATVETRTAMGLRAVKNLVDFFSGAEPRDRVG